MVTIGRQTFEPKHGTSARWDTCSCRECCIATQRPVAPAIRAELALMVKSLAAKVEEYREAAEREWAPHAVNCEALCGELSVEAEAPYVERQVSVVVARDVTRLLKML